ncbi:hypothetical protein [Angelakisella massiliensis]|uniref:hypothetical protein n=1 Tax=Angelakisella massiliensis TaxID=1871018 RepID=UPI0023A7A8B6|nr:hypothetical protein [Angelakisella massiliensis]
MINLSYFPYKRNRYYDGKLLSVSEFETEQKYMNDKRRLSNRFLGGFGVVCGLQVVAVSEERISIEPGVGLDGYGREIVVAKPDVRRLTDVEGYSPHTSASKQYLYLEYNEHPADEVRQQEYGMEQGADSCCNSIVEDYSLYLSDRTPEPDTGTVDAFYWTQRVIYEDDQFQVQLFLPRYLSSGKPFYLTVKVLSRDLSRAFSLKMRLGLHCVRCEGKDFIDITLLSQNTPLVDGAYQMSCLCQSMNITEDLAQIQLDPQGFSLEAGHSVRKLSQSVQLQAVITNRSVEDCVTEDYSARIFQYASYRPCRDICLAALYYDGQGKLQRIREVPFGQRVATNGELALENMVLKERLSWMEQRLFLEKEEKDLSREWQSPIAMAEGDAVIPLGIGGKVGKRFFSEEIAHGLGLGKVTIVLGVEENEFQQRGVVYGSPEIFDERQAVVMAETAALLDPAKGTFIIGARLLEATTQYELKIHWTAFRYEDQKKLAQEKKLLISSPTKSIRVMESVYLSVKFVQMNPTDLIWSVVGENSGSINGNGCYTAPNHPGVYEVQAVCAYDPDVKANTFLVVKP